MRLTARQLNRATLDRQLLLGRASLDVVEGVRRIVALQAQEPASPYLALWARLDAVDPADLDVAFRTHAVVKATLMRITLHTVHAGDYPAFHAAMLPRLRASRLGDPRFRASGVTVPEADALLAGLLQYAAVPRTRPEMEAHLAGRSTHPQSAWWALRTLAPLHHAPVGGPWSFPPRASYVAAPATLPDEAREGALRWLARRYLEGFGPASPRDLARFTLLTRTTAREAMRGLGDELVELEGPDGGSLFDLAGAVLPPEDSPAPPRLLPMWDSILLAYADGTRIIPSAYRRLVTRANGDVLPTLLVDGHVAGVWRPVEGGIEATAFHPLPDDDWEGLAAEACRLVAFLASRDPAPYRRYGRWWTALPGAQVRMLPG